MLSDYATFLTTKQPRVTFKGLEPRWLPSSLFPFQQQIVTWALQQGRAALFLDTGLGKTRQQLVWAQHVVEQAGDVLIFCPLAVARQTADEAQRIGLNVTICREATDTRPGINLVNYDRLHLMDLSRFAGVVLDESSCLKAYDSKTRQALTEGCADIPYRLCCTATPAPNDYMELGNHAEFLGAMSRSEMLATYFVHDGGNTSQWRLKGHAVEAFWRWVATWAVALTHPSALGDTTPGYDLPPLTIVPHVLAAEGSGDGLHLFPMQAHTLTEQRAAKRAGLAMRVEAVARLVNMSRDPWLVWCDLNDEGNALAQAIPEAVQIAGADTIETKESRITAFCAGEARVLISKASITGFGLNFQHCAQMAFVGIGHSFESWYQAIRRCYRFGQTKPVTVHMTYTDVEAPVLANLQRKEAEARAMQAQMQAHLLSFFAPRPRVSYHPQTRIQIPAWLTTDTTGDA